MAAGAIEDRVSVAVDAWLRWVPSWRPGSHRGRARLCRRCTGSPLIIAAGLPGGVPHQVIHALLSRMHRIIDRRVDEFTEAELPALHAELATEEVWRAGGYDPGAGLAPEYDGMDPDPEPGDSSQPFLFTLSGLAAESQGAPPLPRPPLSAEEKQQLRAEVARAGEFAESCGREVCFALVGHRDRITAAIDRFVEPQIEALLSELSEGLEPPS
ncbi:spermidine/putrescine ABC transporter substrate-binding protein [Leucobacter chromiireducens]|uniref:spermidine/putrescine ABC transporter substrate-binding protein n=1 Tax=Leucobacter chromiireducens TaxID=283877 RepID=UPI0019287351|nr:spermidine/putrescine ABC transporter substrate-binding protein [Leucobacter chromiireducens]